MQFSYLFFLFNIQHVIFSDMTYIGDFLVYFFFWKVFFCNIQQKEAFIEIEKHLNKTKNTKEKSFMKYYYKTHKPTIV